MTSRRSSRTRNLQLVPREGFNTLYIGMNQDVAPWSNAKVREAIALGIDRQALIDQFFPAGSEVATHFAPCSMPFACGGDAWYEFDPEAAKALLAEGLTELGFTEVDGVWMTPEGAPFETTVAYRDVDRTYLPLPDQLALAVIDQVANNLGIPARPDEVESTTYIDISNLGLLHGLFLLGWNGDYPDVTNFLDYPFRRGRHPRFGALYPDIVEALAEGSSTADPAAREAAYAKANDLIKQNVPMDLISHAGSATAWQAGLEGVHSSPLSMETLAAVDGGEDGQFVFMQSGEPGGLYCGDESDGESLRVCYQVMESLYGYEVGGFGYVPRLAEECAPNEDLPVDLHATRGRHVPRWLGIGFERRRQQLRGHVGYRQSAPQWPLRRLPVLVRHVGWIPEPSLSPRSLSMPSCRSVIDEGRPPHQGGAPFTAAIT